MAASGENNYTDPDIQMIEPFFPQHQHINHPHSFLFIAWW